MDSGTDEWVVLARTIKRLTGTPNTDLTLWPTPDEGALSGDVLTRYLERKEGIRCWRALKIDHLDEVVRVEN